MNDKTEDSELLDKLANIMHDAGKSYLMIDRDERYESNTHYAEEAMKLIKKYASTKAEQLPRRDYYDNPEELHDVPCRVCGSKEWTDWLLLPHKLFNEVGGYICFPCFIKSHPLAEQLASARDKDLGEKIDASDDLDCSKCWRTPTRLLTGLFYCGKHYQEAIATLNKNNKDDS